MVVRSHPHRFLLCAAMLALVAGCAGRRAAEPASTRAAGEAAPGDEVAEEAADDERGQRTANEAEVDAPRLDNLVRSHNRFAFDLFHSLDGGNVVVSPYAVAHALTVLLAGADGETRQQIRATLRLDMDEADVHQRTRQLAEELRRRERGPEDQNSRFRLRVATSLWHRPDIESTPDFAALAQGTHALTVMPTEFAARPDDSLTQMNQHILESSGGRLDGPLVVGDVTPLTKATLLSLAHFRAAWAVPFPRGATKTSAFQTPAGVKNVALMRGLERFGYFEGDGLTAVELPYAGSETSALFVVGDEGFESSLDANRVQWLLDNLRQRLVEVRVPKFDVQSSQSLAKTLGTMGMPRAFLPDKAELAAALRDRSGSSVALDELFHEARVSIDEDGTAAASSAPLSPSNAAGAVLFDASRPFVFIIRDNPTGAILFVGRVDSP